MRKANACLIIGMALLCFATSAQIPELINYQGRLVDGGGLVTGYKTIVFRLFTNDVGGAETYAETQTITVIDGLYSTMLGASNSTPGSLTTPLSLQPCWLEVEVDGTPLTPRERLVAVPYAMSANEADPLWNAEKAAYATGTPLYAYTETDPVYSSEKSGLATGMPVYVETDPVWLTEKSGYATGTPLYVYSETDPQWSSEKAGYATGTPVYAESDPVWASEKSRYATGTPLYAYSESDPIWTSEKAAYATGTPLYVYTETDSVWTNARASGFPVGGDIDLDGNSITNIDGLTLGGEYRTNWPAGAGTNFLDTETVFGGDLSGTYSNLTVTPRWDIAEFIVFFVDNTNSIYDWGLFYKPEVTGQVFATMAYKFPCKIPQEAAIFQFDPREEGAASNLVVVIDAASDVGWAGSDYIFGLQISGIEEGGTYSNFAEEFIWMSNQTASLEWFTGSVTGAVPANTRQSTISLINFTPTLPNGVRSNFWLTQVKYRWQ